MEQAIFEIFDFLVKVKVLLGQSFLFIYLFFCKRFGPGQDEWVKSGWPGKMSQTGVVEDDVIHDVIAL